MIDRVELSKRARKQLKKVPRHIVENLAAWVDDVEDRGLEEVRRISGIMMSRCMETGWDKAQSH